MDNQLMVTLRVALSIYMVLYVSLAILLPAFRVRKKAGIEPIRIENKETLYSFVKRLLKMMLYSRLTILGAFVVWPDVTELLSSFVSLASRDGLAIGGLGILFVALSIMVMGQQQMGNAWRIGVNPKAPGEMVTHGLFRYSRNPIYIGMRLTNLGLFLVLPNALTLVLLVLGDVVLQIQVRLEEDYLRTVHGAVYDEFCRHVPRWVWQRSLSKAFGDSGQTTGT
jgi:protein-S-isoprenylcysteine O-methyltransferase Ste14